PPPAPQPGTAPSADDLIQEQRRRIAVEEQRITGVVDDSIKQANQILGSDPDAAQDILKRTYASVRDNPELGDRVRNSLMQRLESGIRSVANQAGRIKLEQEEALKRLAVAQAHVEIDQAQSIEEERTRRRLQQFSNLMSQARFEDAYAQSLAIIKD